MTDEFLKFEGDNFGLDDFQFDVSSTIPEHELLEFHPTPFRGNEPQLNTMDPTQLLQTSATPHSIHESLHGSFNNNGSLHNGFVSPVMSPYTGNSQLSSSFHQQRKGSIYDTLESIASPGQQSTADALTAQYFSPPANRSIPHTNRKSISGSYQQGSSLQHLHLSVASPGTSLNEPLSPYSSFDALRSPRIMAASPGAALSVGSAPKQQLSKEEKLRRRREFHNQVERRRRDLIKEKIKELGVIVPPSLLHPDDGKEAKASKTVIINRTVQYVGHLHRVLSMQRQRREQLEARIAQLEGYADMETPTSTELSGSVESRPAQSATLKHEMDFDMNDLLRNEHWDLDS